MSNYIQNLKDTTSDILIIIRCLEISWLVISLSVSRSPEIHLGNGSTGIGTAAPSIFRLFLTSIWYPAYKVGADRSYDRCPCATRTEGIYCDRSTARGRHPRRAHGSARMHVRAHETRVHVIHGFIHFHPTTRRHERTVRSLRREITLFVSGTRCTCGKKKKERGKRCLTNV